MAKTSREACQSPTLSECTFAASKKTHEACQSRTALECTSAASKKNSTAETPPIVRQTRRVPSSGKKTLEHRELMEMVFTGISTTGKHHWTPREKVAKVSDVSSDSVDSIEAQPFVDPIPTRAEDVDSDSSIEPVLTINEKRKQTPLTSCGKSKKATSGVSVIAESMNNLTNVARIQNQQVTVRHLTGNESLYTISESMQRLRNISSLLGTLLFHFASTLMDNTDYREVMMC